MVVVAVQGAPALKPPEVEEAKETKTVFIPIVVNIRSKVLLLFETVVVALLSTTVQTLEQVGQVASGVTVQVVLLLTFT